jgi:hypothetical protein
MVTTKPKDKNSKPAIDTCDDSEDDFGLFEVFRANNIPGHNKSIQLLASLLESDNYTVSELKAEYNNGPGITIFTHGSSNTEYKIEVFSQPILLAAFDNKMSNLDNDDSKILTVLSTFCPLIIKFKTYFYKPIEHNWCEICIESAEAAEFGENREAPHRLDTVASLALALVDDLTSAKFKSMFTLRRSLLRYWKTTLLLNENVNFESLSDFMRIGVELFEIENGD